jgi:biofilm PGA synthesis protein PgaD
VAADPKACIDAPELLTVRERARDTLMTAGMWAAYLYLWVPLISLFAWLLGFEFAYDVIVRAGGVRDLEHVLQTFAVAIVAIFAVVSAWSYSNRLRYRGLNRRHAGPMVPDQLLADYFGVEAWMVSTLREARRSELAFTADGRPELRGPLALASRPQAPVAGEERGAERCEQQAVGRCDARGHGEAGANDCQQDEHRQ